MSHSPVIREFRVLTERKDVAFVLFYSTLSEVIFFVTAWKRLKEKGKIWLCSFVPVIEAYCVSPQSFIAVVFCEYRN